MTSMLTKTISVIIPARNEERELPHCLAAIDTAWKRFSPALSTEYQLEIVVVLNRCTDNTESIARSAGCRLIVNDAKNLAAIRNTGIRFATGQYIVTIDADSRMSSNLFESIIPLLASGKVAGGGVLILPSRYSLGILLTGLALVPIALWYRISAGLFFFTKEAFDGVGGFNELLPSVEDIEFAKDIKRWGATQNKRFKNLLRAHIVTSTRKFDRFGDWFFLLHPLMTIRLLRGIDPKAADKVWYDFPR